MKDLFELFMTLGTALGLGLMVGLERERAGKNVAGFRTFAITTLFGAIAGILSHTMGGVARGGGGVGHRRAGDAGARARPSRAR